MGYETTFVGKINLNKEIETDLLKYLKKFCDVRHMKRDVNTTKECCDDLEKYTYNGQLGNECEFYIGDLQVGIIDVNIPPKGQPGLWCDYKIGKNYISPLDGNNYNFKEWLEYLIEKFFAPNEYVLNGRIKYVSDNGNTGIINVKNNTIGYLEKCLYD